MAVERCSHEFEVTIINLHRGHWNFFSGTQLTFGPRATSALRHVVARRKAKRVFLITDKVLESAGVVQPAKAFIEHAKADLFIYNEGEVAPTTSSVNIAADAARDFQPDLFVAIGGGSNMDLAKATCAVVSHDVAPSTLLGFDNVPGPTAPLVCLPTTSGTGSELSHSCILKNSETGKKAAILSQYIRPDIAIVDPYLSVTCPKNVTAESGIDALTHAIEAYLVTNFFSFDEDTESGLPYEGNNPFGDMYSEKAIELVGKHLQRAVDEPEDIAARTGMSMAAMLGGAAFSNCGVGLAHALEYPIGAKYGCSHGIGNGIVLPEVMRFIATSRANRVARIAGLLGAKTDGLPTEEAASVAIKTVADIRAAIGLPERLHDVGADESDLPELAKEAFGLQRLIDLTPGSPTEVDGLNILKACY